MIHIDSEGNRIDWNAIHAEYIGGGISQRKLAAKYSIPVDILLKKANREKWKDQRDKASNKAATKAQQKIAEAAADNATLAEGIKHNLLLRLKRIEEKYPLDATEVRSKSGNSTAIFRIRDLTAAYKDLTADMVMNEQAGNELLQSLLDLERGAAK